MKNVSGIYAIKCLKNGMYYVGQTANLQRRIREHFSSLKRNNSHNHKMQSDYNKYGEDSFNYEILCITNDGLDDKEREYISKFMEMGLCYNVFSGGRIGYKAPKEFADAVSKRFKGRKASEETRQKKSEATKKQWKECDGYAERMAEKSRERWEDPDFRKMMIASRINNPAPSILKLNKEKVLEARERFANGEKLSVMAEEYGVKYAAMYRAVHKITWRYI